MQKTFDTPTHVTFVLDETGSMQSMKAEAIQGFNKYVEDLQRDNTLATPYTFSLLLWDSAHVEWRYDRVDPSEVKPLDADSYRPGASTPLYDTIVEAIRATEAQAEAGEKVMIVIFTDGQENASREVTRESLQAILKEKDAAGWAFVYLGVSEAAWANEQAFAGTNMAANVMRSAGGKGMSASYSVATNARRAYADGVQLDALVTDADKATWGDNDADAHKVHKPKTKNGVAPPDVDSKAPGDLFKL